MDQNVNKQTTKSPMKLFTIGFFIILLVAVLYVTRVPADKVSQESLDTKEGVSNQVVTSSYKDGSYTSTGFYVTPAGDKHITVKVTLKDSIVTDSEVLNEADDPISVKMQNVFIDAYKEFVVGKKLSDINLTKVSGSSLTSAGFNEALEKIKDQAKI